MAVDEDGTPDFAQLYRAVAAFEDAGEEYERIVRRVYEAVLVDGDTAVDVGAHVGKHAVPMALACGPTGHVVAVEPIDWAIERLRLRLSDAGLDPVTTTYYGCCGDAEGSVSFTVVPNHPGWSSMAPRAEVTESVLVTVPQTTVDALCADRERVRFVKIDVEGAEPLVLRGAARTLERFLPMVHVEVIETALDPFGLTPDDAVRPLLALGYRLYDLLGIDVTEPALWAASSTVPEVADYVAIHPDDPGHEAAVRILRSSFLAERRDRGSAPPGLLPAPDDPAPDGPAGTPWPVVGAAHHDELVTVDGQPTILCSATGTRLPLGSPVRVRLPLAAPLHELPAGGTLQVGLDLLEAPSTRNLTVTELAWSGSALTTLVRLHRDGALEVLWLDGDRVLRADRCPVPDRPQTFAVRVARHGGTVLVDAGAGAGSLRSQPPASVRPAPTFAITVGGRGDARFQNESIDTPARLTMRAGRLPASERAGLTAARLRARWRRLGGRTGAGRPVSGVAGQKGPVA